MALLELKKVTKIFKDDATKTPILAGVSLSVNTGDFVAIMGPSGSGKSTLMNIIGLLDRPSEGTYNLDGEPITDRTPSAQLAYLRRQKIGFIFQSFNLLSRMNATANIELPMVYSRLPQRRKRAAELLEKVGLNRRAKARPNQLSGGEQQRVAIARALANNPRILLADEPTGNLDSKSGKMIMDLFSHLNKEGLTIIMVTHDTHIASYAKRTIRLKDGRINHGKKTNHGKGME